MKKAPGILDTTESHSQGVQWSRCFKRWSNIVVPTDPWWYRGAFSAMSGSLYVGTYGSADLWRFNLNDRGTKVKNATIVHQAPSGILDVAKGPGGWLYYLTNSSIRRIVKN